MHLDRQLVFRFGFKPKPLYFPLRPSTKTKRRNKTINTQFVAVIWQRSADDNLTVGKHELFNLLSTWTKICQAAKRQQIVYKIKQYK